MNNKMRLEIKKFLAQAKNKRVNYTYRLYKRKGSKVWYLEFYRGRAWSLGTVDKRMAQAIRIEIMNLIREGKLVELNWGENITLGEFMDVYLADAEEEVALGNLRPSTIKTDYFALKKFRDIVGAHIPLRVINQATINRFKKEYLVLQGNTETTKRGCNTYIRHLLGAFNFALEERLGEDGLVVKPSYIDKNPFIDGRGRRGGRVKFKVTKKVRSPLLPEEIAAIRKVLREWFVKYMKRANDESLTPQYRAMAQTSMEGCVDTDQVLKCLLFTGVRMNEMVRLEERDIIMALKQVKVRAPENPGEQGYIKDSEERLIPMSDILKSMFESRYPKGIPQVGGNRLVFSRWTTPGSLSQRLTKVFKAAGVNKVPYSTRASFASYQIAEGVDPAVLQKRMGHESLATTEIYISPLISLKDGTHGKEYVKVMEDVCRQPLYK
jgi:integrase